MSFFLGVENRKKLGNRKKKAEKEKSSSSHLDVLVGHLVQQEQDVRLLRVHGRVVEPARDGVLDRLASRLRLRVDLRGAAADQRQRGDGDRERALRPGSGVLVLLRAPGPRLERRPGRHEPPHDRREQLEQQLYSWGYEVDSNASEVHIHHLRRKLNADVIQTVRGIGYTIARGQDVA